MIHPWLAPTWNRLLELGARLPLALLFVGPAGLGKRALADAHRPDGVEGEAPERQRGDERDRPVRPAGDQPVPDGLGEVARHHEVDADREVWAVLLEG